MLSSCRTNKLGICTVVLIKVFGRFEKNEIEAHGKFFR